MKKLWILALAALMLAPAVRAGQAEAQAAYKQANAAFKNKQYANALELYQKVEQEEASYSKYVQGQMGHCYYAMGDHAKALYHYEQHLQNKPNDATVQRYANALKDKGVLPDGGGAGRTPDGEKVRNNIVFINPAGLAFGLFNAGYERAIGNHNSFLIDGSFQTLSVGSGSYTLIGGSAAWHFTGKRISGFFAGPRAGFMTVTYKYDETDYLTGTTVSAESSGTAMMFGGELGYQWVFDNGFMLNLGGGAQYVTINVEASASASSGGTSSSASASGGFSGVLPTALLNIGFAF